MQSLASYVRKRTKLASQAGLLEAFFQSPGKNRHPLGQGSQFF